MKKLLFRPRSFLLKLLLSELLLLSAITHVLAQSPGGVSNTNLRLWLMANKGTTFLPSSTNIDSWTDQSPASYSYSPVLGNHSFNSNSTNFNPAIEFDGNAYFTSSGVSGDLDYETGVVYIVMNGQTSGNTSSLLTNNNEVIKYEQYDNTGAYGYTELAVVDREFRHSAAPFDPFISKKNTVILVKFEFDDSGGGDYRVSETSNGSTIRSESLAISNNRGIPITQIGNDLNATVSEIIVFGEDENTGAGTLNSVISSSDRTRVESYLSFKYGITLTEDSNFTYLNSNNATVYTNNATYKYAVVALAKDSGSGLDQRISKSQNAGSILTLATDNDATSSSNTHQDVLTDGQYLIVAHDNGNPNTTTSTEFDATLVASRIDREWRVENTGNVGTIVLTFDGFNNNYLLITDSDGDFSSGASIAGSIDENGKISVSLNDNSYFTLASKRVTNWNGSSSVWNDAANWSNGIPNAATSVTISSGEAAPVITTSPLANVYDLTINSGATLTLQNGSALTLNGKLTNSGTLIANSGSSILLSGTHSGNNISYNRALATNNWYLISSPVERQDIDIFIAASDLASGTGSNVGLGIYLTSSDTWSYYETPFPPSLSFESGHGHSIKLNSPGAITFNGTIRTSDVTDYSLNSGGQGFNLLGNPFPSYLNGASFLTANTSALASQTLYLWNESTNRYETYVTVDNFKIAPVQGFFIQHSGSQTTVSFSKDWQSHESTDTFQRNVNPRPEVHLTLSNGTAQMTTKIYYIDGTTTGFDNGYDGSLFAGASYDFALFSRLIDGSNPTINYAIQSLPNSDFSSMVIPLGIIADSGTEITFTAALLNSLPDGIPVILEDREKATFTRLDKIDASYVVSLHESLNGTGRFYLHTNTQEALSIDDHESVKIELYTTDNRIIHIKGLYAKKNALRLYNVLGQEVFSTNFESNGNTTLNIPKSISKGVFIIQLESNNKTQNSKKIILK